MTAHVEKLAQDFTAASRADWLALVDKVIKGADFDKKLVSKTADGLRIEPLYTPADALPEPSPIVRGAVAAKPAGGWHIRQFHIETEPAAANAAIHEDLVGGVTAIALQIAGSGGAGLSPDAKTLAAALQGVELGFCPVTLVAGDQTGAAAQALIEVWEKAGLSAVDRAGSFGADPIGDLARLGRVAPSLDARLAEAAALAKTALSSPHVQALVANGEPYHMAGASEAQELAAMLSTLVAYLRALEAAGIAPKDALAKIELMVALDDDQFLGLAKLRALRKLAGRVAEASGAGAAIGGLQIGAVTSMRMLTKRDPWNNILRTTIACVTGALGGADAICVLPFTMALGKPDGFARRVARNVQIVCQEESNLGRVADPAGGSWYIERLTADLAAKAWSIFQEIEGKGGIVAALKSGFVQGEIEKIAAQRRAAIATGRQEITGVSAFPLLGDDGVKIELWPVAAASPAQGALEIQPLKQERLAVAFEALRDTADQHAAKTGKPLAVFLASIGQVVDHNIRSTWVKNYLAAGGISAAMSDGYPDAASAAAAFKASGAAAACICSSDAIYAEHAVATAKALKAAGAKLVLMAGKPGEAEAALKAAGVDQFLFAGADAVATLSALQTKLGFGG